MTRPAAPKPLDRSRSRAALVSVVTASSLIAIKLVTAILTGSLAIVASLVDSVLDLVASGTNFMAIRHAETPPDADHGYGHGKAESLSGLAQTVLVLASAAALVWQSIARLITPEPMFHVGWGIAAMGLSTAASLGLTIHLRRSAKRLDSVALEADSLHYMSDVLTNIATIGALVAWHYFSAAWVDPVVSLVIAIVLGLSAREIGKRAIDQLMDKELPDERRQEIMHTAANVSEHVRGIHELRTRKSGRTTVVDLHADITAHLSFVQAHDVSEEIREAVMELLGDAIVNVHADPAPLPAKPREPDAPERHH